MEKKIDSLPLTSTHWGTYRAKVTNGRVQELYGFEYDNDPSPIGSGIIDVQDGPTRISKPLSRGNVFKYSILPTTPDVFRLSSLFLKFLVIPTLNKSLPLSLVL